MPWIGVYDAVVADDANSNFVGRTFDTEHKHCGPVDLTQKEVIHSIRPSVQSATQSTVPMPQMRCRSRAV